MDIQARKISVKGLVQGVGFRPFIYRIARRHGLAGWVHNSSDGVHIFAEGDREHLALFIKDIRDKAPASSDIHSFEIHQSEPENHAGFRIRKSRKVSHSITRVSPDIAVCRDCLSDMNTQDHRIGYPFTNCTHCGPRFTIIRELPYDRPNTTMAPFEMCEVCRGEYDFPDDRRFHAQPVACNHCGPVYTLYVHHNSLPLCDSLPHRDSFSHQAHSGTNAPSDSGKAGSRYDNPEPHRPEPVTGTGNILDECVRLIRSNAVVAVKGLGGFHLMCDATSDSAVRKLRNAKQRNGKPFAVMVPDIASARRFADVSAEEATLLTSWRRPIVLLKQVRPVNGNPLAEDISPGFDTAGLMLPYMPFHHQLFDRLLPEGPCAIVMTSGNLSDEPIVTDNESALDTFSGMADATLTYNRDIHNRTDDSVAFVSGGKPRLIRRSRGYVPEPVHLPFPADGIFAAGAELNHCFAIGKGNEILLSQHIGDLKDPATYEFFDESAQRLCRLFRVEPGRAACDLHPDYLSTRYAHDLRLPVEQVQHHHAHIAAAMAEFHLEKSVIGICWDGTGLGTDGTIWGGEFLHADFYSFGRYGHFGHIPLPGGDKAAEDIWRTGASLLYRVYGDDIWKLRLPFADEVRHRPEWPLMYQAIDRKLNAPLSSSVGRLFDAAAAITGLCSRNSFHAEAPMRLESAIDHTVSDSYRYSIQPAGEESGPAVVNTAPLIRDMVADLQQETPLPVISARFHNTLAAIAVDMVARMQDHYGTSTVVLSGGVFQNRYLLEKTESELQKSVDVYSPLKIPCNDAGIALGQLAVAARRNI